jgi:hypothetical protein
MGRNRPAKAMPFEAWSGGISILYIVLPMLEQTSACKAFSQIMRSVLHTTPHAYWQLLPTFPACSDSDLAAHWHVPKKGVR